MAYPALPGRAIPYHEDGTIVKYLTASEGVTDTLSAADMEELNDEDNTPVTGTFNDKLDLYVVFFFPEERVITGIYAEFDTTTNDKAPSSIEGSNDTTNGWDGSWEDCGDTLNPVSPDFDAWRDDIAAIDFTEAFDTYRIKRSSVSPHVIYGAQIIHLYGEKEAGQTADDILFLDADAADAEFSLPKDFSSIPTGTSQESNFKIKNDSGSATANSVTLTMEDPDDIVRISDDGGSTWVTSISVGNLAPGASSASMKIKAEAPAAPTPLQPERGKILVDVGSWT